MSAQKETAKERAARLMKEVGEANKTSYSRAEVKDVLNAVAMAYEPPQLAHTYTEEAEDMTGCRSPVSLDAVRRGDVFIAKTIGGKVRPWVVLRVKDSEVTACAMSHNTETAPGLIESQCRFWPGVGLGLAFAVFPMDRACKEVMRPFTKPDQLAEIERRIQERFAPSKKKSSPRSAKQRQLRSVG